ncbi:hypothetical protein F0562_019538 [Nyssa sinensis]|uniref:Uncharacterized protein n=1 Tax=Nyssa sinensis TaxID=561372 RepID=A0A5J5BPK1_9ASTE|nr:hypothetical protein F0562_019538 [Nyssa sinensis]
MLSGCFFWLACWERGGCGFLSAPLWGNNYWGFGFGLVAPAVGCKETNQSRILNLTMKIIVVESSREYYPVGEPITKSGVAIQASDWSNLSIKQSI